MSARVRVKIRDKVRLYDTDASGLIFYGAATRWVTAAQSELWDSLGHRISFDPHGITTPVRAATLEYHQALHQHDEIDIEAWVDKIGRTSVVIAVEIRARGELCVSARMTHVCVDLASMSPQPVPAWLADAVG